MVYKMLSGWLARALPQPCLLCGSLDQDALCRACQAELPALGPACRQCALPLPDSAGGKLCGDCIDDAPAFDASIAAFNYQTPVRELLHMLKFREGFSLAPLLGRRLAQAVAESPHPRPELVIPVPLHLARLGERGFNQAQLIARPAARQLGLRLLPDGCLRVKATHAQSELELDQRKRNLRRAFAVNADVKGKRVAIVDDVMTTGATLGSLAKTLKQAGAVEVQAWCVARTGRQN